MQMEKYYQKQVDGCTVEELPTKNSEVEQPEDDPNLSRIPYSKYTDPGTKEGVTSRLSELYKSVREIYTIGNNIRQL